jgi:hypothetical protein
LLDAIYISPLAYVALAVAQKFDIFGSLPFPELVVTGKSVSIPQVLCKLKCDLLRCGTTIFADEPVLKPTGSLHARMFNRIISEL